MAEQVDMIVQPEGPIVVLNRNQLIQFDANGTRNTAFGINGVGELPSTLYSLQLNTMTRQPDGYILVGGSLNGYFCLLRYLPSGLLDSTFHAYLIGNQPSPGRPLPDQHDNIYDIIVQPDGSITAVGYTSYWNDIKTVYFSSLLRFTSNGLPDISFGYNGITAVSASFIGWYYFEADIQPDLVFTGASITGGQLRLTRTQPDGAQDTVFGNNGEVIHNLGPYFRPGKVLITAEEKILVGGIQWNGHDDDIIVARFNGGASVALDDPSSFSGLQLFPNPATSDVTLQYTLHTAEAVAVWLVGYDGRKVADLEPAHWQAPGLHTLSLRLPPLLTSGYYFIACSIGDTRQYIPFQKE
ncbi:MAG: hypothetical protein SF053_10905 [Bacteroidia bacterium]|nr:hypothetical protein [Bacteroidia bacterium]